MSQPSDEIVEAGWEFEVGSRLLGSIAAVLVLRIALGIVFILTSTVPREPPGSAYLIGQITGVLIMRPLFPGILVVLALPFRRFRTPKFIARSYFWLCCVGLFFEIIWFFLRPIVG